MASLNKVMIIGNAGKDAELRYMASGTPQAQFSVAVNNRTKKDGEWVDETEWFNVVLWGEMAERVSQYITKGKSVYVEGRLQTRSWEADGQKHYRTEIVADKIVFLADGNRSERSDADDSGAGRGGRSSGRAQRQDRGAQGGSLGTDPGSGYADDPGGYGAGDDDIPF